MLLSLAIRIGLVIAALPALSTDIPDGFPPGQFTDRKIDGSMSAPSCNNELKLPCFDQGGQRAIYDLAKTQAKYFIFGFAVQDDAMDARLKSFGLQQVFAGCVIDERGYEAGYNKTIEAAFGPEFRETIFPDRDYREDQFKTLKAQTSPLDKH